MQIQLLQKDMEFKNYKEICDFLGMEYKEGTSKRYQLENLSRYIKYYKNGHRIIIEEIYDTPIKKKENRGIKSKKPPLLSTHPEIAKRIKYIPTSEISALTMGSGKEVSVECEECLLIFKQKIISLCKKKCVKCNRCSLSKYAKRIFDSLVSLDITFKLEHDFDDLIGVNGGKLRFDFALFDDNKLIGLIEYDGGYHDTNETIITHDQLKNDYCLYRNIPLLRIHHTENKNIDCKLVSFLKSIKVNLDNNIITQLLYYGKKESLEREIKYYEIKIQNLKEELKNHTEEIKYA